MSIIRKGVQPQPKTFWMKKKFAFSLDNDGGEHCLAAVGFPAYTYPSRVWLHWEFFGFNALDPWATSELIMKGRHVNVPEGLSFADNATTLMNTYAPVDESAADGSVVANANTDLTGEEHPLIGAKRYTFLDYDYTLGMATGKAYNCNANAIRYFCQGRYDGNLGFKGKDMVTIDDPHMMFIGALTNAPYTETDESNAMFGNGHNNFQDMRASLVDYFEQHQTTGGSPDPVAYGANMDTALVSYQSYGYETHDASEGDIDASGEPNAEVFKDDDLVGHINMTVELKVYEPDFRNVLLAP